jgi:hypothetical protein
VSANEEGDDRRTASMARFRGVSRERGIDEKTPQTYYGTCGWKFRLDF